MLFVVPYYITAATGLTTRLQAYNNNYGRHTEGERFALEAISKQRH
jgi:hypothetical protein